jgi:DNA transformation protein and related proteins
MARNKLKNIGPQTSSWLEAVDITSLEDLDKVGVVMAYLRLQAAYPQVSLNALWAMQGALMDLPWNQLPPDIKQALLAEVAEAAHD